MSKKNVFNFIASTFLPAVVFAFAFSLIGNESPKIYHAYLVGQQFLQQQPMVAGACDVLSQTR